MRLLRFLLFPIGCVFFLISKTRNYLYDSGIWKSFEIPIKSICVGNLSLGGTGKSPLVAYLIENLKDENQIQILSRGYGRKTQGFLEVELSSQSSQVGDEPLMYKKRFGDEIHVSVCESRKEGIETILKKRNPNLLILDDAFQHRKVKAGFSIVVSDYSKLFYKDFIFPIGNLRESKTGLKRSDLVLISKCPENLNESQKREVLKNINCDTENVFFSSIKYSELKSFSQTKTAEIKNVLLVTGIANPTPLKTYLEANYRVELMQFKDHHQFSLADIEKIHKKFDIFADDKKAIVTSEKDYMRLVAPEFSVFISEKPWLYQAISIQVDRENEFLNKIKKYVRTI
ncbi:MAG: tetraacyldisaccharide 4'-kinase [Flavobacteriia bacterium]